MKTIYTGTPGLQLHTSLYEWLPPLLPFCVQGFQMWIVCNKFNTFPPPYHVTQTMLLVLTNYHTRNDRPLYMKYFTILWTTCSYGGIFMASHKWLSGCSTCVDGWLPKKLQLSAFCQHLEWFFIAIKKCLVALYASCLMSWHWLSVLGVLALYNSPGKISMWQPAIMALRLLPTRLLTLCV